MVAGLTYISGGHSGVKGPFSWGSSSWRQMVWPQGPRPPMKGGPPFWIVWVLLHLLFFNYLFLVSVGADLWNNPFAFQNFFGEKSSWCGKYKFLPSPKKPFCETPFLGKVQWKTASLILSYIGINFLFFITKDFFFKFSNLSKSPKEKPRMSFSPLILLYAFNSNVLVLRKFLNKYKKFLKGKKQTPKGAL